MGLGVSHSAARSILALVFARLYKQNFTSFVFSSFVGSFFENRLSRFLALTLLGDFPDNGITPFFVLYLPDTIHTYIFNASFQKKHQKAVREPPRGIHARTGATLQARPVAPYGRRHGFFGFPG